MKPTSMASCPIRSRLISDLVDCFESGTHFAEGVTSADYPPTKESKPTMTMTNLVRTLVAAMASIVIATTCTLAAAGPALMTWTA